MRDTTPGGGTPPHPQDRTSPSVVADDDSQRKNDPGRVSTPGPSPWSLAFGSFALASRRLGEEDLSGGGVAEADGEGRAGRALVLPVAGDEDVLDEGGPGGDGLVDEGLPAGDIESSKPSGC